MNKEKGYCFNILSVVLPARIPQLGCLCVPLSPNSFRQDSLQLGLCRRLNSDLENFLKKVSKILWF